MIAWGVSSLHELRTVYSFADFVRLVKILNLKIERQAKMIEASCPVGF